MNRNLVILSFVIFLTSCSFSQKIDLGSGSIDAPNNRCYSDSDCGVGSCLDGECVSKAFIDSFPSCEQKCTDTQCQNNYCSEGCADCKSGMRSCMMSTGSMNNKCVECINSFSCNDGFTCKKNFCVKST